MAEERRPMAGSPRLFPPKDLVRESSRSPPSSAASGPGPGRPASGGTASQSSRAGRRWLLGWEFQQMAASFFRDEARLVARCPLAFVLGPLLLTVGLSAALFVFPERLEERPSENRLGMFLPEGVPAVEQLGTLKRLFPPKDLVRESYDVFKSAYAYVIVEDASERRNVLRQHVLRVAADVQRRVLNLHVRLGWLRANFTQLCHKEGGECLVHPVLILLNATDPLPALSIFLRYPSFQIANQTIYNSPIFGSVSLDREGVIRRAGALRLPFLLAEAESAPLQLRLLGYLWQKEFQDLLAQLHYPGVNLYYSTALSWAEEIDRNGQLIIPYIPALFAVLVLFSVSASFSSDLVRSKPWLGLAGIANGAFAVLSTLGTLVLLRYPFLQMVFIMPFLILSISVDNMFLMLSSWRGTEGAGRSVEERMSSAIGDTAVSIMITALTDGLSFSVGSISQFPAVRIFCTYCALAVLFVFLYQMSFFLACMALSGRREAAGRSALTFRPTQPRSDTRRPLSPPPADERPKPSSPLARFLASSYADFLERPVVKVLVLVFYTAYLAGAVYGLVQLPLGLDLPMLVPSDSYTALEFHATQRHFTEFGGFAYAFIDNKNGRLPLHSREVTGSLLRLYRRLCRTEFTSEGQFWLPVFRNATGNRAFASNEAFVRRLRAFLTEPAHAVFANDVHLEGGKVRATKMLVQMRNSGFVNNTRMAGALRGIFAEAGLPGFVYEPTFVLVEQQERTLVTTVQNVGIAVGVMLAIAFLFIPKLVSSLWIGISILSINLGVIGGLALWGVHLDIVSMITIVMSIGFSVDFVAHITFHFLVARPPGRMSQALGSVGVPILQSALSTVLGVSTLIPANSYMVRTFVKTVGLVVGLGTLHGLLFLPVILSIFVPADTYLQGLGAVTSKVSHYLATNLHGYLPGIGNKRMRAYHAHRHGHSSLHSLSLESRESTPQLTVPREPHRTSRRAIDQTNIHQSREVSSREVSPLPTVSREALRRSKRELDRADLHESAMRRRGRPEPRSETVRTGASRAEASLPPPPPPPVQRSFRRSLHNRRSHKVASIRHSVSLAHRSGSQDGALGGSKRRGPGKPPLRPPPRQLSTSSNDIYDFLHQEPLSSSASFRSRHSASDSDVYSQLWDEEAALHHPPERMERRGQRLPSPPDFSLSESSQSRGSQAPLLSALSWRERGSVPNARRAPPSIYVPSADFPRPPPSRLYLRRGPEEHRQSASTRRLSSRRPSRQSHYIPPPPRQTQEFFLRRAPPSRSLSSPDLRESDWSPDEAPAFRRPDYAAGTFRAETVEIQVGRHGTLARPPPLSKSQESLLSDAFTAFRPGGDMRPAFGAPGRQRRLSTFAARPPRLPHPPQPHQTHHLRPEHLQHGPPQQEPYPPDEQGLYPQSQPVSHNLQAQMMY